MKTMSAAGMLASVAGGLALQSADLGQLPWLIARESGLVAFALLSLSVTLGLLVSTKAADGLLPRVLTFELHQFLSVLTVSLLGVHAGALLFDASFHFTPISILVPFASPYAPLWTGLGVIGGWTTAAVTASFWMRRRIGQKAWRRFHYLSFLAYWLGLVHGFTAGTDTNLGWIPWLYIGSAATVAGLLVYRIALRPEAATSTRSVAARVGAGR